MQIAVIGLGVIGSAVKHAAEQQGIKVSYVDPRINDAITLEQALSRDPDAIFLCLPTPSRADGTCDVSILESVLSDLSGFRLPIISHSTAPWELYEYWQSKISCLVHVPEFVTEARAKAQYVAQDRIVMGGTFASIGLAEAIMRKLLPNLKTVDYASIGEAAFVKYMTNCFLAMKVIFSNQMCELSKASGMSWNKIHGIAEHDARLGASHWQVPGPDGNYGYGGMCFPKDVDAMLSQSDRHGVGLSLLEETKKANRRLRDKQIT